MTILDLVLSALNTAEETKAITDAIALVEQYMKEYCSIEEIPKEAYGLWCEMVCAYLKETQNGGDFDVTALAAMTMGDVSYQFDQGGVEGYGVGGLIRDFRQRLHKIRKGLFR